VAWAESTTATSNWKGDAYSSSPFGSGLAAARRAEKLANLLRSHAPAAEAAGSAWSWMALLAHALVGPGVEPVAAGDKQAEHEKGARRQDGDQEAGVIRGQDLDAGKVRKNHLDAGEQGALADQFAHGAQQRDNPDEADAHH
jgi:hypothetical protein